MTVSFGFSDDRSIDRSASRPVKSQEMRTPEEKMASLRLGPSDDRPALVLSRARRTVRLLCV
jgi:hypothetical protein